MDAAEATPEFYKKLHMLSPPTYNATFSNISVGNTMRSSIVVRLSYLNHGYNTLGQESIVEQALKEATQTKIAFDT